MLNIVTQFSLAVESVYLLYLVESFVSPSDTEKVGSHSHSAQLAWRKTGETRKKECLLLENNEMSVCISAVHLPTSDEFWISSLTCFPLTGWFMEG